MTFRPLVLALAAGLCGAAHAQNPQTVQEWSPSVVRHADLAVLGIFNFETLEALGVQPDA